MMLSCREVSHLIAGRPLEETGWWRRLSLRLHLAMCRHCRRYAGQMQAITQAIRTLGRSRREDPQTLERLSRSILTQLGAEKPGEGPPEPPRPSGDRSSR